MISVNDQLLNASVLHQVYLQRYQAGVAKQMVKLLRKSEARVLLRLQQTNLTDASKLRLNKLLVAIQKIMNEEYGTLKAFLDGEVEAAGIYESIWQMDMFSNTLPVEVNMTAPAPAAIYTAVKARPFQGRLLKDWYKGLSDGAFRRVREAIQLGFTEGQTTDQIVRALRGTAKNAYADGVLSQSRRGAEAAVRTALNHTAAIAREQVYRENADVIKGVRWSSTLDNKTTKICASRDGNIYQIGKGPRPPAHINCRSTTVPVTKSWNELGAKGKFKEQGKGKRASMNGAVAADLDYDQWLRKQPISIQEDVLGIKGAALFRDGKLPIQKFVSKGGKEYTLEYLKEHEKEAWKQAFPTKPAPSAQQAAMDKILESFNVTPTPVDDLLDMGDAQVPSLLYVLNNGVSDEWLTAYTVGYDAGGEPNQGYPVHEVLNDWLRSGELNERYNLKYYDNLNRNMDGLFSPLKEGLVLYRGSTRAVEMDIGDVFPAEGYMSTSLWKQTSFTFGMDEGAETIETIYEIRTPKGTKVIISSEISGKEREVILGHGQAFRVIDIQRDVENVFTEGAVPRPVTIRQYITLEALQ